MCVCICVRLIPSPGFPRGPAQLRGGMGRRERGESCQSWPCCSQRKGWTAASMCRSTACWLWWQNRFPCSCFVPPTSHDFSLSLSQCLFPIVNIDIATVLVDFREEHIKHVKLCYILTTSYMWILCLKSNCHKYWSSRQKILELPACYVSSSHLYISTYLT